jgi:CRP-like cAMP-binding protein
MDILQKLKSIQLFSNLKDDDESLEKIVGIIRIEKIPAGHYIINEGEIGNKMYILFDGIVRVEGKTVSKDKFTIAKFHDSFIFGESALMDNEVRSASVYAETDCECYVILNSDFEKLCDDNPTIGYKIIKEIAKSLIVRLKNTTLDKLNLISALINEDSMIE